ncbi:MAG: HslU--HslV peptidase ATPase subunit [Treponema sp.]|nr:MAG: HslU--HslV peptidase ATPase subunit [Treponema sp.]
MDTNFQDLTPKQIVSELDKYIIGQNKAKRAVAIAMRNRVRRMKLPDEVREEISPKNILMIGPTGVGKTEIARRLAKLSKAPFLKVEATKYTEVGYVGRDVESMIRDLMKVGFSMVRAEMQESIKEKAEKNAEEAILDLLLPGSSKKDAPSGRPVSIPSIAVKTEKKENNEAEDNSTREKFRKMLREGKLEDRTVEINTAPSMPTFELFVGGNNIEDFAEATMNQFQDMLNGSKRSKRRSVSIKDAREIIMAEQLDRLVDRDKIVEEARHRVEQTGIIFIDEIDKVAAKADRGGADVSREGVQRDILPIVEGSQVSTKFGIIDTKHILFIAAGAFNISKPSDLIPEFQGRFPLRVELESLHAEDFKRILVEPKNSLTTQYKELLKTEKVEINFNDSAIDRIGHLAAEVNSSMENIGARRLHTLMEMLTEEISFNADEFSGQTIEIDVNYVDERLKDIVKDQDLSRYIL